MVSLLAEPTGKPKNTGVGSLYLLQWIFLTQELNREWGGEWFPTLQADSLPAELPGKLILHRALPKSEALPDVIVWRGCTGTLNLKNQ